MPVASGGGDGERAILVDPLGRFGHEDDVDVRDVVELAAAGLAHADDREPASSAPSPYSSRAMASPASSAASASHASCSAAVGMYPTGSVRREVQRGDAAAARAGRRSAGRRRPLRSPRCSGADRGDQALPQTGRRWAGVASATQRQWSGMSDEVVDQGDGAAEDGDQPVASRVRVGAGRRAGRRSRRRGRGRVGRSRGRFLARARAPRSRNDSISRTSPSRAWSGSAAALSASGRPSWKTSSSGSAKPVSAGSCSSRSARPGSANPSRASCPPAGRGPRRHRRRRR